MAVLDLRRQFKTDFSFYSFGRRVPRVKLNRTRGWSPVHVRRSHRACGLQRLTRQRHENLFSGDTRNSVYEIQKRNLF